MLVSIVIGALNEEQFIGATLKSANAQKTSHKIEVIVGDGYSTDKTTTIAKQYGAKVSLEKNRSAAWERQAGVKIAKGEVVAFTDADAEIPNNWIQQIAEEFEKDKNLVMLYGPVYFSDTNSFEKSFSQFFMKSVLSICALFGVHNPIGSNIAVRKTAFEKAGGFDTSLVTAEDLELVGRMNKQGKIKFSSKVSLDVSARRVKKWGYFKYALFHVSNALRFHITGKSSKEYNPVR